ncbi:pyridoxal phosphate-dependent aminotransferase, partial [Bifidobacterium felsineum]|uniref:pyridoxal phosphate-dependent aminotransferase n=1 Tax=Bifidobacterium felsineum TaxID=2045440 RepID=UPI001BDBBC8C
AQAFFVIHFFGRKTEYAGTPLTLTESTAQRRTDTHENNNSAIIVDSFSKTFAMTGWRIGCAFGPKAVIDQMMIMQENVVSCVPGALQMGAVAALEGSADILATMIEAYRTNRDMVVEAVQRMPLVSCNTPDGAFYVLINVKDTGMNDHDFAVRLLNEAKVVVTPASGFGSRGQGYVRLSYVGTAEDTAEGLRRMQRWLESL